MRFDFANIDVRKAQEIAENSAQDTEANIYSARLHLWRDGSGGAALFTLFAIPHDYLVWEYDKEDEGRYRPTHFRVLRPFALLRQERLQAYHALKKTYRLACFSLLIELDDLWRKALRDSEKGARDTVTAAIHTNHRSVFQIEQVRARRKINDERIVDDWILQRIHERMTIFREEWLHPVLVIFITSYTQLLKKMSTLARTNDQATQYSRLLTTASQVISMRLGRSVKLCIAEIAHLMESNRSAELVAVLINLQLIYRAMQKISKNEESEIHVALLFEVVARTVLFLSKMQTRNDVSINVAQLSVLKTIIEMKFFELYPFPFYRQLHPAVEIMLAAFRGTYYDCCYVDLLAKNHCHQPENRLLHINVDARRQAAVTCQTAFLTAALRNNGKITQVERDIIRNAEFSEQPKLSLNAPFMEVLTPVATSFKTLSIFFGEHRETTLRLPNIYQLAETGSVKTSVTMAASSCQPST